MGVDVAELYLPCQHVGVLQPNKRRVQTQHGAAAAGKSVNSGLPEAAAVRNQTEPEPD